MGHDGGGRRTHPLPRLLLVAAAGGRLADALAGGGLGRSRTCQQQPPGAPRARGHPCARAQAARRSRHARLRGGAVRGPARFGLRALVLPAIARSPGHASRPSDLRLACRARGSAQDLRRRGQLPGLSAPTAVSARAPHRPQPRRGDAHRLGRKAVPREGPPPGGRGCRAPSAWAERGASRLWRRPSPPPARAARRRAALAPPSRGAALAGGAGPAGGRSRLPVDVCGGQCPGRRARSAEPWDTDCLDARRRCAFVLRRFASGSLRSGGRLGGHRSRPQRDRLLVRLLRDADSQPTRRSCAPVTRTSATSSSASCAQGQRKSAASNRPPRSRDLSRSASPRERSGGARLGVALLGAASREFRAHSLRSCS